MNIQWTEEYSAKIQRNFGLCLGGGVGALIGFLAGSAPGLWAAAKDDAFWGALSAIGTIATTVFSALAAGVALKALLSSERKHKNGLDKTDLICRSYCQKDFGYLFLRVKLAVLQMEKSIDFVKSSGKNEVVNGDAIDGFNNEIIKGVRLIEFPSYEKAEKYFSSASDELVSSLLEAKKTIDTLGGEVEFSLLTLDPLVSDFSELKAEKIFRIYNEVLCHLKITASDAESVLGVKKNSLRDYINKVENKMRE